MKNAGVTKTFGGTIENDYEDLKSQLSEAKKENLQAREMLKKEILRLSFLYNPLITVKTVGFLTSSLSFGQLLELKENLEQDLKEKENALKGKTKTSDKNINEFKITKKEN